MENFYRVDVFTQVVIFTLGEDSRLFSECKKTTIKVIFQVSISLENIPELPDVTAELLMSYFIVKIPGKVMMKYRYKLCQNFSQVEVLFVCKKAMLFRKWQNRTKGCEKIIPHRAPDWPSTNRFSASLQ